MMKPVLTVSLALGVLFASETAFAQDANGLWSVYNDALKGAKYIDLTHVIKPNIPVWYGFGPSKFMPTQAGSDIEGYAKRGDAYSYEKHGFEATHYDLVTDQLGTQLDPPAHWAPEYPSIDELPATYAVRPLVVISIVDKVASDPGYHLQVADIEAFEKEHGTIPEGTSSGTSCSMGTSHSTPTPRRRWRARRGSCTTAMRRRRVSPASTACRRPAAL